MDKAMQEALAEAKNFDPNKAAAEAKEEIDKTNNIDYCPVCQTGFIGRTKGLQFESRCKNGHTWHLCAVHGLILEGAATAAGYTCTCK